jgi:hypothetical protein
LGTGWDACTGDIGPKQVEDCATPVDDNCDSQVNENCACSPGASAYCYSGPVGTDNHPPCKGGTHLCNADGHGYGACTGEVDPVPEDCATPADENCDGVVNDAASGCVCNPGAKASCYNGPAGTLGKGICVAGLKTCDGTGKAYLPGCPGEVDPGIEDCSNSIDDDCSGTYCMQPLWTHDYGTAGASNNAYPWGVATDSAGNTFVAGSFSGSLALGATTLISSGAQDAFLVKLDPSGSVLWARQYGGASGQDAWGVATDSQGNAIVVGTFTGTISIGGNMVTAQGTDAFVLKVDPTGALVWSQVLNEGLGNGNGYQSVSGGVSVDKNNDVLITGNYDTGLRIPGAPVITLTSQGGIEFYVAKLSGATGAGIWGVQAGDVGYHVGTAVRTDTSGNVVVAGDFTNTMKLGATTLTASAGGTDMFVARMTSGGQFSWALRYGSGKADHLSDLRVDSTGAALFAGKFLGTLNLGGQNLVDPSATSGNLYVAKVDVGGFHVWSKQLGSSSGAAAYNHGISGLSVDSSDNLYIFGSCGGTFDLIATLTCGAGVGTNYTPFLIRLSPAGALGVQRTYGVSAGWLEAGAMIPGIPSTISVAGYNKGGFDFGSGPNASLSGGDMILSSIVTN